MFLQIRSDIKGQKPPGHQIVAPCSFGCLPGAKCPQDLTEFAKHGCIASKTVPTARGPIPPSPSSLAKRLALHACTWLYMIDWIVYLLLTASSSWEPYCKFRPSFSYRSMHMAQGAINRSGKRGSVTYSTDREDEAIEIFILSLPCVWRARKWFLFTRSGFIFLMPKFEIIVKRLLSR